VNITKKRHRERRRAALQARRRTRRGMHNVTGGMRVSGLLNPITNTMVNVKSTRT
jgi:hypothetical protein